MIWKYLLSICKLPFDFVDVPLFGVWCGPTSLFWSCCFWCEIQKVTAKTDGKKTTSMYSSRGLIAYSLMLKFLIPFYLMFVYGKRQGHSFIFFKGLSSFLSAILKTLSFPHWMDKWLPFHKLTNNIWVWFLSSFSVLLCWSMCLFLCQKQIILFWLL